MTARVVRAPRAGLADAAPRCSAQPGSDAIAGRGSAGRAADLSGPTRPVPVAGWCRRPANMSLAVARATPRPRDTQPRPPRPHEAGGPGAGTPAGRGARPSLRDVLARRGDPRGGHHRGIPGTAPGSPSCGPRATSTGRAGWPAPRCRCPRHSHAALSVPPALPPRRRRGAGR